MFVCKNVCLFVYVCVSIFKHICTEEFGAEKRCHVYYEILINIIISATLNSAYFEKQSIEMEINVRMNMV